MGTTPGFDIVYDREAHVFDESVNDGVHVNDERRKFKTTLESVFPSYAQSIGKALSQAQQDHER